MKKKISIRDVSAEDAVLTMAMSLDVPTLSNKNERSLELPKTFGKGFVKSHTYENGIGVVHAAYSLVKDFHFEFAKDNVHPLKLIFNIGDTFDYKLERDKSYGHVHFCEVIVVASIPTNNHRFVIPANSKTDIFSLEINRKMFEKKMSVFLDEMDVELSDLFRDVNGVIQFYYRGSFSYDIGIMIREFCNCELIGLERALYLEGKTYEIFGSFIKQYIDDTHKPDKRSIFRKSQTLQIKRTATHITDSLQSLQTVHELAKEVGLSANVLQNGFRSIYNMTVNEFIQNERLLLAKKLLSDSDYSISEITYQVGLNSKSYLSKVFLERYKCTPTEFRSRSKVRKEGTN